MRLLIIFGLLAARLTFADVDTYQRFLGKTRAVQAQNENAYRVSGAMTAANMKTSAAAVETSLDLLKQISLEANLDEDERGLLYQYILGDDEAHGSLARVFWSGLTRFGADNVDTFGDREQTRFRTFAKTFREVFLGLSSLVTYRVDQHGRKLWTARDHYNRERLTRGVTVQIAEWLGSLDTFETRSKRIFDFGNDSIHFMAATGADLRRERVNAEVWAGAFFGGMTIMNLFGPMILPLVPFNWVGFLTGGAWGSAPLSGAGLLAMFGGAGLATVLGQSRKTYLMLRELERLSADPGPTEDAQEEFLGFKETLLSPRTRIGGHREKMISRGYRPGHIDCANRLTWLVH